jgi:hypothetical protein
MLGLFGFLLLGSVRDGVPTHHAARVLLPIWFLGCVFAGHWLAELSPTRARAAVTLAVLSLAALLPLKRLTESCAARAAELEAGIQARRRTSDGLSIDTADYGYFAVQVGFGSALGTSVLDEHDPRHRTASPFGSAQALDDALRKQAARFALVTSEHEPLLPSRCGKRWSSPKYSLFECSGQ